VNRHTKAALPLTVPCPLWHLSVLTHSLWAKVCTPIALVPVMWEARHQQSSRSILPASTWYPPLLLDRGPWEDGQSSGLPPRSPPAVPQSRFPRREPRGVSGTQQKGHGRGGWCAYLTVKSMEPQFGVTGIGLLEGYSNASSGSRLSGTRIAVAM
jgi:hypothetical protein